MTVLQALAAYYDQLQERGERIAQPGYAPIRIAYALVLAPDGEPIAFEALGDPEEKRPGRICLAPQVERTSGIKPAFLWDKTAYALGVVAQKDNQAKPLKGEDGSLLPAQERRTAEEHAAFVTFHRDVLAKSEDPGLTALLRFLDAWEWTHFTEHGWPTDALDQNITFRLETEDRLLFQTPAAKKIWAELNAQDGDEGLCLVTGARAPIAELHPGVKGVVGGQSSGSPIVSFNLDAFESFGKKKAANAPVSEEAAFKYATALNWLLAQSSSRKVRIADTTVVFWADARPEAACAAEEAFGGHLERPVFELNEDEPDPDTADHEVIRRAVEDVARARAVERLPEPDPDTRMHLLGIAPNAGRQSIRLWLVGTYGAFEANLRQHVQDLALEPDPWGAPGPVAWALLYEVALNRDAKTIPPRLAGELMRAIVGGGRYPRTLLATTIGRIRADHAVNGRRVAILKAVLNRDARLDNHDKEEISMSLDRNNEDAAYRLGRLFALLERAQDLALGRGLNAPLGDRFIASASATPARVFPVLIAGARPHVSKLRKKGKGGLAHWIDAEIGEVWSGLEPDLPRSLNLEAQGRFFAGYYHQRFARKDKEGARNPAAEAEGSAPQSPELDPEMS